MASQVTYCKYITKVYFMNKLHKHLLQINMLQVTYKDIWYILKSKRFCNYWFGIADYQISPRGSYCEWRFVENFHASYRSLLKLAEWTFKLVVSFHLYLEVVSLSGGLPFLLYIPTLAADAWHHWLIVTLLFLISACQLSVCKLITIATKIYSYDE